MADYVDDLILWSQSLILIDLHTVIIPYHQYSNLSKMYTSVVDSEWKFHITKLAASIRPNWHQIGISERAIHYYMCLIILMYSIYIMCLANKKFQT